MSKIVIYHNPRCSKSRQALEILEKKGCETEVVEYLKTPLTEAQFKSLFTKLSFEDQKRVLRTKEADYKSLLIDGVSLEKAADIFKVIEKFPKLLERPIVESQEMAIIGRPPENIKALFSKS